MATPDAPAKQGSKPEYEMTVDQDVFAEMRDGARLSVDVHRPDATGPFPALLSITAYNKAVERVGVAPQRFTMEFACCEAGDPQFWATHGYVHVIADTRGTGLSEGTFTGPWSPQEALDGYDLVEWIAEQDWCDGNVGMIGLSYLAITQCFTAAQRPPHLKAIFPHDGFGDLYRDIFARGGIPSVASVGMDRIVAATDAPSVSATLYDEQELESRVDEVLADEDNSFAKTPLITMALKSPPAVRALAFDFLLHHGADGPYWRERSSVEQMDQIDVPVYLGSELHTHPTSIHLAGANWGWDRVTSPKKLAFRPHSPGGVERPFHEFHDDILRWYDHWLRGVDTGIMDEPPVKVWVRGREEWRYAEEWPLLEQTEWQRVYLRENGRLTVEQSPEATEESATFDYEPMLGFMTPPFPLTPPPQFLQYVTDPFEDDVEVIGPMALHLHASLSGDNADFIVSVKDVDPDGEAFPLTRGWLRASHREVDPERSEAWRPFHPHTNPAPLTPNKRYEFAIGLQPVANLFKAGHRLKLEIWPCDYPNPKAYDWTQAYGILHSIPFGKAVSYEVHHAVDAPSHLLIPRIGS